jgi:uncharacterized protein YkwD
MLAQQSIGHARLWPRPITWALGALALALLGPVQAAAGRSIRHAPASAGSRACSGGSLLATRDLPRLSRSVLCLINLQRLRRGLRALARNGQLDRSASFHCADMLAHHYYAHNHPGRPSLLTRIEWTSYFGHATHGFYAENLGEGPRATTTPQLVVHAWMKSPEHRRTVLDPRLRDVGIGVALTPPDPAFYAHDPAVVLTTDFGDRRVAR